MAGVDQKMDPFHDQRLSKPAKEIIEANHKTCDLCGKVFQMISALYRHKSIVHGVSKFPKQPTTVPNSSLPYVAKKTESDKPLLTEDNVMKALDSAGPILIEDD